MGISFDSALGLHDNALKLRGQRAAVLADNLANANTPNYKARDLDFRAALEGELSRSRPGLEMSVTQDRHRQGGATLHHDDSLLYRTPSQPSIDGNTVEEHIEHAEYMKNSLEFQANFTFLNSRFRGLMTALRGE